jgi:hypothetical protein
MPTGEMIIGVANNTAIAMIVGYSFFTRIYDFFIFFCVQPYFPSLKYSLQL